MPQGARLDEVPKVTPVQTGRVRLPGGEHPVLTGGHGDQCRVEEPDRGGVR